MFLRSCSSFEYCIRAQHLTHNLVRIREEEKTCNRMSDPKAYVATKYMTTNCVFSQTLLYWCSKNVGLRYRSNRNMFLIRQCKACYYPYRRDSVYSTPRVAFIVEMLFRTSRYSPVTAPSRHVPGKYILYICMFLKAFLGSSVRRVTFS